MPGQNDSTIGSALGFGSLLGLLKRHHHLVQGLAGLHGLFPQNVCRLESPSPRAGNRRFRNELHALLERLEHGLRVL